MNKKVILALCVVILVIQVMLAMHIEPDMSEIGKAPHKLKSAFGIRIPLGGINVHTIGVTWGIMLFLILVGWYVKNHVREIPGRVQALIELLFESFDKICNDTLGDKGRLFMPYVTTLFLFILCCNWVGIIPLSFIEEPTRDLNTTLALGIISFFVSHIAAMRYKGVRSYVANYFEPMIEIKGVKIPNVLFMPLNVIGELGKVVSHSFRLFGNILGGAIIMQVVSNLIRFVALPVGLNLFFGLFVGTVQAFVFAMLALTYISVLVEG